MSEVIQELQNHSDTISEPVNILLYYPIGWQLSQEKINWLNEYRNIFFVSILIGHKSNPIVPGNTHSYCSKVTENIIWIICIWFREMYLYLSKWKSGGRNHLWIQILKTCTYTCSEAYGNAVLLSPDISLSRGFRKKRGADTTRWVPSAVDRFQIKQSCGRCRIKPRIQSRCFYLNPL